MPEKIDFDTMLNHHTRWLFCESVGGLGLNHPVFQSIADNKEINVEMKINGIDVSFMSVLRLLDKNFEKCVDSRANEIVKERAGQLMSKIHDLDEHIKDKVDEIFPDHKYNGE